MLCLHALRGARKLPLLGAVKACRRPIAPGNLAFPCCPLQMWPLLRDVPWQRALLVVLIAALFYLHYRWAVPAVPPACLVVGGLCAGSASAGSLALLVAVQQVPSTLNGRRADIAPAPVLSVLHAATARWTQPLNCLHAMLIVALLHACRTFKRDPGSNRFHAMLMIAPHSFIHFMYAGPSSWTQATWKLEASRSS